MFNEHRTFGVEIEFVGNDNRVSDEMSARGLDCRRESYNHITRTWWKIVYDSSVSGHGGDGLELVSPPLAGINGMIQLKLACEALEAAGVRINRSCGLHVHHDASDFEGTTFLNLAMMYLRFEKTLDSIMAPSRRDNVNTYCQSNLQRIEYKERIYRQNIENSRDVDDLIEFFDCDRKFKLNFCSYRAHGTMEFRHHQGSFEFPKIANWVALTQLMVERAIDRPVRRGKDGSWDAFKDFLGCNHNPNSKVSSYDDLTKALYRFYNKRRRHFAAAA